MLRPWHTCLVVLLALVPVPAGAAGPYLVADLDTTPIPGGSITGIVEWVELGGHLYFAADDGQHGRELWRTDGTSEGTRMITDLCPGPCSSLPSELTVFNGRVAFSATDGFHGREIWLSDGTRQGTVMPRDLCPGSCSTINEESDSVVVGGRLFFLGRPLTGGYRLGVTDGSAEGTRWLAEPQASRLSLIGEFKGRLAFSAGGASGQQLSTLWLSDGTPEGTSLAVDLCALVSGPCLSNFAGASLVEDRIVFFPAGKTWSTDGTAAGTRQIADAAWAAVKIVWKGALYFSELHGGFWRSDGTPEGTVKLRSYPPTPSDSPVRIQPPSSFVAFGDSLFFIAAEAATGLALWRTQGTAGSIELVFDPRPGSASVEFGPLTGLEDRIVFPVFSQDGTDLWETDGSGAGTRPAARLCNTSEIRCVDFLAPLSPVSLGDLYLFALKEETAGTEVWTLDGGGSVRPVRDIFRQPGSGRPAAIVNFEVLAEPRDLAALGARLVFSARTGPQEPGRLWASDGTAAGTAEIGPDISWPSGLVQIGSRLWLRGAGPTLWPDLSGQEIWSTDGTAAGTGIVRQRVLVDSIFGGRPGLILFAGMDLASSDENGIELWTTNGTAGGTGLVKDISLGLDEGPPPPFPTTIGPSSSLPSFFERFRNSVLFAATEKTAGREPWITDGTAAGTRLLLDIKPTPPGGPGSDKSSDPGPFVRFGGRVFFAADDGVRGRELWRTDGTAAGTTLARDLRPGAAGSHPRDLVRMGTRLFFLADGGDSDALWTMAPEGQVTRVRLLAKGQRASSLVAAGNRLFFVVDEPATGPELWTSTGTRAGTRKVLDIRPGALGSYPQELTAVEGLLLFAADDGVHGLEPWVSDGTAAGTRLLADLASGVAASGPGSFTLAGELVAFDADDGIHGRELWAVRKADLAAGAFPTPP